MCKSKQKVKMNIDIQKFFFGGGGDAPKVSKYWASCPSDPPPPPVPASLTRGEKSTATGINVRLL